jgi:hypothetical protein
MVHSCVSVLLLTLHCYPLTGEKRTYSEMNDL